MSYHAPTPEEIAEQHRDNPTVVEVGIAPLRVTVPITNPERKKEAVWAGVLVVGAAGALLYFGGSFIKDLIRG